MKFLTMTAVSLVTVTAVFFALIYVFQSKLAYFPSKKIEADPKSIGLDFESVRFSADDKTELFGWYIPKKGAETTLLFLHGNAGNISHRLESIKVFNSLGMNVFIFDYRGYGKSRGRANEQNTYDDAMAAWEYLLNQKRAKAEDIIIFGRSLGGSIAAYLGAKVKPRAVILESTFSSAKDFISDVYPLLPQALVRYSYETKSYLKDISAPILIIHSEDDDLVPFKHGKSIFESANEPKSFLKIGGDHNFGFIQSQEIYLEGLRKFLQRS